MVGLLLLSGFVITWFTLANTDFWTYQFAMGVSGFIWGGIGLMGVQLGFWEYRRPGGIEIW